jgi:hypothetical protein
MLRLDDFGGELAGAVLQKLRADERDICQSLETE